ncbi:hypothetical protein VNO80_25183 [Phaseolus coccineus]|uniref:Uncharacterized protein n=1 Tax=Phaseolus coccineus TaxID=3886 RepID=A0AAN9LY40_PHACN
MECGQCLRYLEYHYEWLDICPEQGESSQPLKPSDDFLEKNIHSGTTKAFNSTETDISRNATKLKQRSSTDSNADLFPFEAKAFDSESNLCISSNALNTAKPHQNDKLSGSSQEAHNIVHKIHEALPNEDLNTSVSDTLVEGKEFGKRHDAVEHEKQQLQSYDEMEMEDNSKAANHLNPDVVMKDKELGEVKPMIAPTKAVLDLKNVNNEWHEFFHNSNRFAVGLLWLPVVLIYLMAYRFVSSHAEGAVTEYKRNMKSKFKLKLRYGLGRPKRKLEFNQIEANKPDSLRKFGETAEKCLADYGVDRPSMGDVLGIWSMLSNCKRLWFKDASASTAQFEGTNLDDLFGVSTSRVFSQLVKSEGR